MTDYKHFPRLPRRSVLELRHNRQIFYVLCVMVVTLMAMSYAAHEDMKMQQTIDKHQLLHETRRAVQADEQAALYFYNERARGKQ